MTPDELDAFTAAVRDMPLVMECLETAAAAVDQGSPLEAIDLVRDAGEILADEHPELGVNAPTLAAMLSAIVAEMRNQRIRRATLN